MKKNSIYKIGIIVLLVANGVLVFLLVGKPPHPNQRPSDGADLKVKISNMLELNSEQEARYFELAQAHRMRMVEIEKEQRELIASYFNLLAAPAAEVDSTRIIKQLNKLETEKITFTYRHFEDLKALCNQEQKARFQLIINDILKVLVGPKINLPPPPRD